MSPKRRASSSSKQPKQQRSWFWGSSLYKIFADSIFSPALNTAPTELMATESVDKDLDPHHTSIPEGSLMLEVNQPRGQVSVHSADTVTSYGIPDAVKVGQIQPSRSLLLHDQIERSNLVREESRNHSATGRRLPAERQNISTGLTSAASSPTVVQEAQTSHSETIQTIFQSTYDCSFSKSQFVGLCAYMTSLLRLGYPISTTEMDGFIRMYPNFADELKRLEQSQVEQASMLLIAYHQWYLEHKHEVTHTETIMTEQELRNMWSENPYVFLKAQYSLDLVAKEQRRLQALPVDRLCR